MVHPSWAVVTTRCAGRGHTAVYVGPTRVDEGPTGLHWRRPDVVGGPPFRGWFSVSQIFVFVLVGTCMCGVVYCT